jgi:hypothetical protein
MGHTLKEIFLERHVGKLVTNSSPRVGHFRAILGCVGSENSEPLIPEILSRSALEGEASSKFR